MDLYFNTTTSQAFTKPIHNRSPCPALDDEFGGGSPRIARDDEFGGRSPRIARDDEFGGGSPRIARDDERYQIKEMRRKELFSKSRTNNSPLRPCLPSRSLTVSAACQEAVTAAVNESVPVTCSSPWVSLAVG